MPKTSGEIDLIVRMPSDDTGKFIQHVERYLPFVTIGSPRVAVPDDLPPEPTLPALLPAPNKARVAREKVHQTAAKAPTVKKKVAVPTAATENPYLTTAKKNERAILDVISQGVHAYSDLLSKVTTESKPEGYAKTHWALYRMLRALVAKGVLEGSKVEGFYIRGMQHG